MVVPIKPLFEPVGKVAAAFGQGAAILSLIMGPVGGGKTTECIAKGIRIGGMQEPMWQAARGCFVKKCRGAVIRDTYPQLDRTVIKSWWRWFPKDMAGSRWHWGPPRSHTFTLGFGGRKGEAGYYEVDYETLFIAIGDHVVEDVLRGLELTWLWLNEQDLLPRQIVELGIGRVGRYPSGDLGRCLYPAIFGDMNAPEEDNYTVGMYVEKKLDPELVAAVEKRFANDNDGPRRKLIEFYRQPGGLEEGAENLHNLEGGRAYYEVQAAILPPDQKRRLIDNRIGPVRRGMPVFPEFVDDYLYDDTGHDVGHVRTFEALPGVPLLIFADQGICPGALIAQLDVRTDQLLILDEVARIFESKDGIIEVSQIGGEAFGREVAQRVLTRFPGLPANQAWVDPAAGAGEEAINHSSWRKQFQTGLGVPVRKAPVPGNAIEPRLQAVRDRLGAKLPGKPRLLIHSRCTILRKAFNSRYVWQRVAVGSADSGHFGSKPLKVQGFGDVMDACQYGCFVVNRGLAANDTGGFGAPGRAAAAGRRAVVNDSDYPMFGGR